MEQLSSLDPVSSSSARAPVRPAASTPRFSSSQLEDILRGMGRPTQTGAVERAVEVGRWVIERVYGGELGSWRQGGPQISPLKTIAHRAGGSVSISLLYRSVSLYELSQRLGGLDYWSRGGLTISHMRAVLGLREREQRRLLDAALREAWTARRLDAEARRVRDRGPALLGRRGRPRLPEFVKTLNRLHKLASAPDRLMAETECAAQMSPARLAKLRHRLSQIRAHCDELDRVLAAAERSASM